MNSPPYASGAGAASTLQWGDFRKTDCRAQRDTTAPGAPGAERAPERRLGLPALLTARFQRLLQRRIESLDVQQARADVRPFPRDARILDIWSPRYFRELAGKLECA